jgi:hypothetical protein
VQPAHAPPSSRQRNVEPDSDDEKPKLADALATVSLGPDEIVVCGAVVSGPGEGVGVGDGATATVKFRDSELVSPSASVTLKDTTFDPAVVNVNVA